uniref:PetP protein n=1 Tax=Dichotomaria marginata TaxID=268567 RepID=A0A1G4NSE3_9FLOR|nr:hypothetical protein P8460_pgp082 [Dichotomaria marginata]SCW21583.1 petP [Dichotomaria marginata]
MYRKEFINVIAKVYQKHTLCPSEIIYNNNTKCIIKGFRYINKQYYSVPLIEFDDNTRMWVLPQELQIEEIEKNSMIT